MSYFYIFTSYIFFFENMPTIFRELLGEGLLQYNEIDKEFDQISTSQLNGKTVVLYFSYVDH